MTKLMIAILLIPAAFGCGAKPQEEPRINTEMPNKILWAWERPEDLRFIDPKEYGIAFLAQTIYLEKDIVTPKARKQPLEVPDGAYLIAVTRIETKKGTFDRPTFSGEMIERTAKQIVTTLELPNIKAVQIDFDAVVSERNFYRALMNKLAADIKRFDAAANTNSSSLVTRHSLTMTSLASWCTGDAWFNDFPVDEAVPMAFEMGADSDKIKDFLRNGNDWNEPLCRASYGISLEEGKVEGMKSGRRMFYFKDSAWMAKDLGSLIGK